MSAEWASGKLGDFLELKRGYDLPQAKREPGQVPLVSSSGVSDRHSVAMVKGPGVVTGRYGTIGQVFYVEEDFWPLNTTLYVRDFKGNDPQFIHYFLKTVDFLAYSDKAAVPGVNRNHLHEALVVVPPIDSQKSIAQFLGALDDRITLLRETNATLEAIAQALFKSWFVDFDPVRAKLEGRTPEGMDEATAALFPDGFETSELGEVPRGWRIGELGDVAALKGGKQLSKEAFSNSAPNPVFGGAGVMGHTEQRNATDFVITVGRVGAYCGQFFWHIGDAWVNNNASHVVPSGKISSEWLLLWLKSVNMDVIKKGAAQPFVSNGDIAKLSMIHPPIELIGAFGALVAPMFARSQLLVQQSVELASVRDTLLPRLFSGQLRLPETENLVKALIF